MFLRAPKRTVRSLRRQTVGLIIVSILLFVVVARLVEATSGGSGSVSLTAIGTPYTQDFNTLTNTPNAAESNVFPTGWLIDESGSSATRNDGNYSVGAGTDNAGDTYSFGSAAGNTDRALGGLRSGTLVPILGASFTNNTGNTVNQLDITYTGEQWRSGDSTTAAQDRLDFQYSLTATTINAGTYTDVNSLDFSGPQPSAATGALNGNLSPNRTVISGSITGLNIPNGATVLIRWTDLDITGSDDALAIDDFSITPKKSADPTVIGSATPNPVTAGNQTHVKGLATEGTTPTAAITGVTADLTPIGGAASQALFDDGAHNDGAPGDNNWGYDATVGVLTTAGNKTIALTVTDAIGRTGSSSFTLTISPPVLAIHDIQGNGNTSPFNGSAVQTSGIVTGVKSNGFFIQTPDADIDADPNTSEGIFVFTSSAPPAAAAVGNKVSVTGTVQEFVPGSDPVSPPATELISPTTSLISSGNSTPVAITLTAADTNPLGTIEQLERFEGMRIKVDSLTVVAPTQAFSRSTSEEANNLSVSNGVFYGVITGVTRPFREPGIQVPDPLPPGAPITVPRFDANPERLRVDSDGLTGAPKIDVAAGQTISNLVGPLDFSFRTYTILPDPAGAPVISPSLSATPVPAPNADEFTVASFNMERFFDTVNDPGISDVAMSAAGFNARLNKVSLAIRNVMRTPDIVAVVEMENLSTLQAIAAKVNADAVGNGDPDPSYVAYLEEGNDVGGIDVGFLVKSARVNVIDVTQEGKTATYINPNNGLPETLNDRPPLILRASIQPLNGDPFPVTVIVNHLRSLNGVDDTTDGNRVRTKRRAQAEFLANMIQARQTSDPTEHIISVGDYNAFQFNDGYVDLIGTIKGMPTTAPFVTLSSSDLVNPDLINLVDMIPGDERYSFSFDGNAQVLDHMLITGNLLSRFSHMNYGRSNMDFPETMRSDSTRPERLSDHDPAVAYFTFPKADLALTKNASPSSVLNGTQLTYTITVTNSLNDPAENATMTEPLPTGTTFQSINAPTGWNCTTPNVGDGGTITCTNPSVSPGAADQFTIVLNVDCALSNGTVISNTATVASGTLDLDTSNNSMLASATVTNPAPIITVNGVSPASLWPPNHKMVPVYVDYSVSDTCGAVSSALTVQSNEPVNGIGDGDTSPDWQIVDAHNLMLRAERAGTGSGRIYTITITATDSAGGSSSQTVIVAVPRSNG